MPLGFVVVTWRRCGANARTDRQRTERRSSPCRRNASGSAISATDRDKGRRHGQFLRFMGAMTVSDRLNAHPIRHALAPLHPTRHPANTLMPIGLVVVAWRRCGANARTYGCRSTGVPRHGRTPGAALFRPRIAGQTALRPVLAVRRHGERAGSSKRKPHPSRVSPSPTQCPACHADRFGRRGVAAVWS